MAESKLTSALIAALEDPKSAGDRIRDVSRSKGDSLIRTVYCSEQPKFAG